MAVCDIEPLLAPCSASTRARSTWETMPWMVLSMVLSQARPSSALREYCAWSASDDRTRIAVTVSAGESEGRLSLRPVLSCSWTPAILLRPPWTAVSERSESIRWVTRITISGPPSG